MHPHIWYRDKDKVHIGGVRRYYIQYQRLDDRQHLFFRLKNIEKISIRAIHLLNGPFILYCDVVPWNFNHNQAFHQESREVHFNNQIKPGQTFNVKLLLNDNSRVKDDVFGWKIDIISQIVITNDTSIMYDMLVGDDIEQMKKINHGPFTNLTSLTGITGRSEAEGELNKSFNKQLTVEKSTEEDLWSRPPDYDKPVHLIIVTHGIFSNLTADMLYLKETLESNVNDNILVKGYSGNAGKTEGGIKKLGTKQGKYLMSMIDNLVEQNINISKISFVGHSLGGLVQLYSIKYILDLDPNFFVSKGIQPHNMVFMASPLLGILNEISFIFSWFLDIGTLGKTGRDLTLSRSKLRGKALLSELPDQLHMFLKSCDNLIIYANIINDGIVPLRTSALLYLDYATLDNVKVLKQSKEEHDDDHVAEISESSTKKSNNLNIYKQFISLNFNISNEKKREKLKRKILDINAKGVDNLSEKTKDNEAKGVDNFSEKPRDNEEKEDDNLSEKPKDNEEKEDDDNSIELSQEEAEEVDHMDENTLMESQALNIPPRASIIESAINTIICPIPNQQFIIDPESRIPVIFHDRFYDYNNIPAHAEEQGFFNKSKKQVKIARKYHNEMNWRKILVRLPSDAHNNIIVRRRFANGYGWGVVDHLAGVFNETTKQGEARGEAKVETQEGITGEIKDPIKEPEKGEKLRSKI